MKGASRAQRSRARWDHSVLPRESRSTFAVTCRVCRLEIRAGDQRLHRPWSVEHAHASCGWLRPDEREPHRIPGAEAPAGYEWGCRECGAHAVKLGDDPPTKSELRCATCRERLTKTYRLALARAGELAEVVAARAADSGEALDLARAVLDAKAAGRALLGEDDQAPADSKPRGEPA